jgi:hypothetical protein
MKQHCRDTKQAFTTSQQGTHVRPFPSQTHMTPNRSILTGLASGLLALAGCSTDKNPPTAPQLAPPKIASNVLNDAPRLVALAASGVRDRGEQDEMLRVEAKVPGFGGFYIDSEGAVVIYLKQGPATAQSAVARTAVNNQYVNRAESNVREIMSRASDAQIRVGLYSLSELIAVEYRAYARSHHAGVQCG